MKVSYKSDIKGPHQIFTIDEGADEIIYEDCYGVRIARKKNIRLVLLTEPIYHLLVDIIKDCGVKSIIETEGVVHGNSKLLGVFSTRGKGICGKVSLPQKGCWYEWFTKNEYPDTDEVEISINPREARVFILKDL
jgi:hypothetical protein